MSGLMRGAIGCAGPAPVSLTVCWHAFLRSGDLPDCDYGSLRDCGCGGVKAQCDINENVQARALIYVCLHELVVSYENGAIKSK